MTEQTFKIKPAKKGGIVRDPNTYKALKATGENKPRNEYWLRRLAEGSVIEVVSK